MSKAHAVLKFFRALHLYIGIFISPMLLFFAFTGALQTFGLNDATADGSYKPPAWITTLAQIHKKQTDVVPPKRVLPAAPKTDAPKPEKPAAVAAAPAAPQKSHMPMKIFFLLVCLSLFTSTLTGVYMAYKYARGNWLVTGILAAGVVVPLVLLKF
jgi:hypothetical protein